MALTRRHIVSLVLFAISLVAFLIGYHLIMVGFDALTFTSREYKEVDMGFSFCILGVVLLIVGLEVFLAKSDHEARKCLGTLLKVDLVDT